MWMILYWSEAEHKYTPLFRHRDTKQVYVYKDYMKASRCSKEYPKSMVAQHSSEVYPNYYIME